MLPSAVPTLLVASNLGNPRGGTEFGPAVLQSLQFSEWLNQEHIQLHVVESLEYLAKSFDANRATEFFEDHYACMPELLFSAIQHGVPFLVMGGDHSCAVGSWSGVVDALPVPEEFGLIWVDAHLDSHTFETTHSGNLHGMPLAMLLGQGNRRLKAIYPGKCRLKPANVLVIGARSYEDEERALLERLGVRWIESEYLLNLENATEWLNNEVLAHFSHCQYVGMSIDLDALDPAIAPAVATPASSGLSDTLLLALVDIVRSRLPFIGLEIAEFSPRKELEGKTEAVIFNILKHCFKL